MLSMCAMTAEGAISYHSADDYYTENASIDKDSARWHGKLAEELGLTGLDFDFNKFGEACKGNFLGKQWLQKPDRKRALYDFTFSAPKSVSIQALHKGDKRIIAAHDKAVSKAMDFIETKARLRFTEAGITKHIPISGLAMAQIRHTTSRLGDPQLHTHNTVFNAVMGPDSMLRSITPDEIMNFQKTADAIYKQVMAESLREAGYELVPTKDGYELAGYDRETIKHFSQRLSAKEEELLRKGIDPKKASAAQNAYATKDTRLAKHIIERDKLLSMWKERAKEIGFKAPKIPKSLKEKEDDARRTVVESINRNLTKAIGLNRAIVENSRIDGEAARIHVENFSQAIAAHRIANEPSQISSIERGEQPGSDQKQTANESGFGVNHERENEGNNRDAGKSAEFADHHGAGHGQHISDSGRSPGADGRTGRGNIDADGRRGEAGREQAGPAVPDPGIGAADGRSGMGSDGSRAAESGSRQHQEDAVNRQAGAGAGSIDQLHAAAAAIRGSRTEESGLGRVHGGPDGQRNGHDGGKPGAGKSGVEEKIRYLNAEQAIAQAMKNLTVTKSHIKNGRDSVIFDAANASEHLIPVEKLQEAMGMAIARGEILIGRNGRAFISNETLKYENAIDTAYNRAQKSQQPVATPIACGIGIAKMERQLAERIIAEHEEKKGAPLADLEKDAWYDRCKLNEGQLNMVRGITLTENGISVVIGDAGTGKSTGMEAVKLVAESQGYAVYGACQAAQGVYELSKTGIETRTIASMINNPTFWERMNSKTILVIDEAGLVGTKAMSIIVEKCHAAGSKLVVVGDPKQFGSVEAGAALHQLGEKATNAGELMRLSEKRRAKNDFMQKVHEMSRDSSSSVIDKLYDKGHINVVRDRDERLKAIGQAYAARTETQRPNTMILTDRNIDRIAINAAVRAELGFKNEATVENFERKDDNAIETLRLGSYEVDDVIRFNSNSGTYKKDDMLRVVEKNSTHLIVEDAQGKRAEFHPYEEGAKVTIGNIGQIALAAGERIRFTANEKAKQYVNGDAATVLSIKDGTAQVRLDKNKEVISLKLDSGRPLDIRYGYCQTGHSTQGGKGELVIKHETVNGLTNKNSWYTTNTRAEHEIRVFTDIVGGKELESFRKRVERSAEIDTTRKLLHNDGPTERELKEREAQNMAYFSPIDSYRSLDVPRNLTRDPIFVKEALETAAETFKDDEDKGSRKLFVSGDEKFKDLVLDIVRKEKLDIVFPDNPEIEERRKELDAEMIAERERVEEMARAKSAIEQYHLRLQEKAQGGDSDALMELRGQRTGTARNTATLDRMIVAPHDKPDAGKLLEQVERERQDRLRYTVQRNGDVTYSRDGRELLLDTGRAVHMIEQSADAIEQGLRLAAQKWGGKMQLTGSNEFLRQAIEIAAQKNMQIDFADQVQSTVLRNRKHEIAIDKLEKENAAAREKERVQDEADAGRKNAKKVTAPSTPGKQDKEKDKEGTGTGSGGNGGGGDPGDAPRPTKQPRQHQIVHAPGPEQDAGDIDREIIKPPGS
jgi:conjugative relaxase-like TrwC/TraI family protein